MRLTSQRRVAAQVLKCGEDRIWFDSARLPDIKQAITANDIRHLIKQNTIQKRPATSISRGRFHHLLKQKRKGRRRGPGSRKGTKTARQPAKEFWMRHIRVQRELLKMLRDRSIIDTSTYHMLYKKAKGGFFRSRRHIKLYMEEHKLGKHETKTKARPSEKKAKRK